VDLEADAVPETVAVLLAVPGLHDDLARRRVHLDATEPCA